MPKFGRLSARIAHKLTMAEICQGNQRQKYLWVILFCALVGIGGGLYYFGAYSVKRTPATKQPPFPALNKLATANPDLTLRADQPIWFNQPMLPATQVVLFRHDFTVAEALTESSLLIFADTRYEVWLDGRWLGRGPARFSRTRHEYDQYSTGHLDTGRHLLAVLGQWAPNIRRSESTVPHLVAHLQGSINQQLQVVTRTDQQWKALAIDAWRTDATPVHTWQLLGPTELLDLRLLPSDWMQPNFDDRAWPYATQSELAPTIAYLPRSIPFLANVPIAAKVIDAGRLSPGRLFGQLTSANAAPYDLSLTARQLTTFTLEMLVEPRTNLPMTTTLDGKRLTWRNAGATRPDVRLATTSITPGPHQLTLAAIPPEGLPFAISEQNLTLSTLPFGQGNQAGRRLLLAEPVHQSDQVTVSPGQQTGALNLLFQRAPTYVVLDLGRTVHGRLTVDVTGPSGTLVDIGWDERLLANTLRPLPYPGTLNPEWNQTDSWILDGQTRPIHTIDARAGRYILIAVWGNAPVKFENLQVYEERYPVTQRGWFHSSNARLDAIWQVGVDTAYPSMQDAYADPWRERGQWWGDAYVTDHVNQVAFGDTALLRRGLLFLAEAAVDGQIPAFAPNSDGSHLLDYAMLWVQSLHDYLRLTDDVAFGTELYPTLARFMDRLEQMRNANTGLLELPKDHWSKTALLDWQGFHSRYGQSTALNALYVGTLRAAAESADKLGHPAAALHWRTVATQTQTAINQHLYMPDQAKYATTIFANRLITPTTHAQAWPLAFNVTPEDKKEKVVAALLNPFKIEIFGMYWVLEGLGNAGHIEDATRLIELYYGRLLDQGATTWWEHWDSNLSYRAALSHSWGSSPTWFLTTRVLGAVRVGPNRWVVQPAFAGVDYAMGAVPLQNGELTVRWRKESCQWKKLDIDAPVASGGEVILPLQKTTKITLNRQVIWPKPKERQSDHLQLALPGGHYHIELFSVCSS